MRPRSARRALATPGLAAIVASLLAMAAAAPARAEITSVSPAGFQVGLRTEVDAGPAALWSAVIALPRWWSDAHTWSGQAANMALEPRAGGCWCERWGDGHSVAHGFVLASQPGRLLRLNAPLGPLQALAVQAVLTLTIDAGPDAGKSALRLDYRVAGQPNAALDKVAPAVDRVLAQQLDRLKAYAETGQAR